MFEMSRVQEHGRTKQLSVTLDANHGTRLTETLPLFDSNIEPRDTLHYHITLFLGELPMT